MKKKRKQRGPEIGVFGFFKKKSKVPRRKREEVIKPEEIEIIPPGEAGLPVPLPESEIIPEPPRKKSMWEVFAPGVPERPPEVEERGLFEVFKPETGPPPRKEEHRRRKEKPKETPWYEHVVPEEERERVRRRARPVEEFFHPRREREERWRREEMPAWESYLMPRHARETRGWRRPTTQEMARHLSKILDLEGEIFPEAIKDVQTREWTDFVEDESRQGRFATMFLRPVTTRELWTDLASFFDVPFEVLDEYLSGARSAREEELREKALWDQVFDPLIDTMTQAFATLKPKELPGLFNLVARPIITAEGDVRYPEPPEYWLAYQESLLGPQKLEYR